MVGGTRGGVGAECVVVVVVVFLFFFVLGGGGGFEWGGFFLSLK